MKYYLIFFKQATYSYSFISFLVFLYFHVYRAINVGPTHFIANLAIKIYLHSSNKKLNDILLNYWCDDCRKISIIVTQQGYLC
jgi:hypothetical protein